MHIYKQKAGNNELRKFFLLNFNSFFIDFDGYYRSLELKRVKQDCNLFSKKCLTSTYLIHSLIFGSS